MPHKRLRVIRPGDMVRIEQPILVDRVGYPKALDDYSAPGDVAAVLHLLHGENPQKPYSIILQMSDSLASSSLPKEGKQILSELHHYRARKDGFGGDVRSIHCSEHPQLRGQWVRVIEVKTVMTGVYQPGYGSRDDYDPAYLSHPVAHRLIGFYQPNHWTLSWIERENVLRQDQIWELERQRFGDIVRRHRRQHGL